MHRASHAMPIIPHLSRICRSLHSDTAAVLAEASQTTEGRQTRAPAEQEAALKRAMSEMRLGGGFSNGLARARETECKTESALMDDDEDAS